MKKIYTIITIICALSLVFSLELGARGRGGHRGGSRGGPHGGRTYSRSQINTNRSPSMNRSSRSYYDRNRSMQTTHQRSMIQDRSWQVSSRQWNRDRSLSPSRSELQNFLDYPVQGRDRDRLTQAQDRRVNRRENRKEIADNIRVNIDDRMYDRRDWFNDNFWSNHPGSRWKFYDYIDPWKSATWSTIVGWSRWGWSNPYYYDGGYYYAGDYDDTIVTPEDYSTHAEQIAASTQDTDASNWMSLGTFALAQNKKSAITPNHYLQLALSKDGGIGGSYYNSITKELHALEGLVDSETQRAVWMKSDNDNSAILETAIYNLTEDEAPVRINFPDGTSQDWTMVRLKAPS